VTIAGLPVFFPTKQQLIEQGGESWWKHPENQIGNGPFQMTRIDQDQRIVFRANERYWAGRPKLFGIKLITEGESSIALQAYKVGQLDIMAVDPSQVAAIRNDPVLSQQIVSYPGAATLGMDLNLTMEPFQDKKIREALSDAFDRKTYCEQIRLGTCSPTLSWIPPSIPLSRPTSTDSTQTRPDTRSGSRRTEAPTACRN